MTAPHEMFYCTVDLTDDSSDVPGLNCVTVPRCESMKDHEETCCGTAGMTC